MPSRVGSIVALPCHVVRSMERIRTHLPGAPGRKTWGIDTRNKNQRSPVFLPWTVTRDVWHDALRPDVSGVAVDALLFHEAGSRLVHRYRVYMDPFPHPALRDGVIPRLLSSMCRAMAIAHLTHLRLSIPFSGAPPGKVPESCFPDAETAVVQPPPRRVSFAADANTLCTEDDSPVLSQISPHWRVVHSRRQYTVHGGRFTGVVTD